MSKWAKAKLGDYIQEYSERNKDGAKIPVYSVTNSNGFCTEYFSKEVASKDKTTSKIVKKGCFAYNPSRINVGSVDWLRNEEAVIVSPLYNVFSVKNGLYQQYLYYYLKSSVGLYYIKELATGSVRDNLKFDILSEFSIPLPPLETQHQIAENLDKVTRLIDLCNNILERFDLLVKSRFVEMFGEPIKNTNMFPTQSLGKVCLLKAGITTSADDIHEQNTEYQIPCYGGNGIRGYVKKSTYSGVFPIIGRQGALCGNVQLAKGDFNATEHAVLVTPLIEMNVYWLYCLLKHMDLFRYHTGAAQPGLAVKTLNTVEIITPNVHLQNQFAAFAEQVDKSKSAVKKVLEKAETLKKALMQEYFG